VTSTDFVEGDYIPIRYSARGEDISPPLQLDNISPEAKSIAITMDDASHPLFPNYNHWVIWNVPVQAVIPEAIPHGATLENLGNARQGIAYGRHRYKGPKPPFKSIHTYIFTVYILDSTCGLSENSHKKQLLSAMEGHILQKATLSGQFQNHRK